MTAKIEITAELFVDGDDAEEIKTKALAKIDEFLGGYEERRKLENQGTKIDGWVTVRPKEFPLSGYVGEITLDIYY